MSVPSLTAIAIDAAASRVAEDLSFETKQGFPLGNLPSALQTKILQKVASSGLQFTEKAAERFAKYLICANPDEFFLSDRVFPIQSVLRVLAKGPLLDSPMATAQLSLKGANLDSEAVKCLFESFPRLTDLVLDTGRLSEEAVEPLAQAIRKGRLRSLSLSFIKLSSNQAKILAQGLANPDCTLNKCTFRFCFDNEGWCRIVEAFKENCKITSIKLENNGIDKEGVELVASLLVKNKTLKRLYLTYNLFEDSGSEAILHALTQQHCLNFLDLTQNAISSKNLSDFRDIKEKNSFTLLLPNLSAVDI